MLQPHQSIKLEDLPSHGMGCLDRVHYVSLLLEEATVFNSQSSSQSGSFGFIPQIAKLWGSCFK